MQSQGELGAHHRQLLQQANAALAASPATALLDCVQTLHHIVLASNPQALRRSVGWLGRLLARDITLQAESDALRGELGVHVLHARQQLQALVESDRQLQVFALAMHAAIAELGQQSTLLASQAVTGQPDDGARRAHYLTTLASSLTITASHIDLTVLHHRELIQRVQQMLPQVELLLDQQRMLHAGLTRQAALQSAVSAMETLQGLQPMPLPDVSPQDATPHDATPR